MPSSPIKLFISHNEDVEDRALVTAIIDFIQDGVDIPDEAIRSPRSRATR